MQKEDIDRVMHVRRQTFLDLNVLWHVIESFYRSK